MCQRLESQEAYPACAEEEFELDMSGCYSAWVEGDDVGCSGDREVARRAAELNNEEDGPC